MCPAAHHPRDTPPTGHTDPPSSPSAGSKAAFRCHTGPSSPLPPSATHLRLPKDRVRRFPRTTHSSCDLETLGSGCPRLPRPKPTGACRISVHRSPCCRTSTARASWGSLGEYHHMIRSPAAPLSTTYGLVTCILQGEVHLPFCASGSGSAWWQCMVAGPSATLAHRSRMTSNQSELLKRDFITLIDHLLDMGKRLIISGPLPPPHYGDVTTRHG